MKEEYTVNQKIRAIAIEKGRQAKTQDTAEWLAYIVLFLLGIICGLVAQI